MARLTKQQAKLHLEAQRLLEQDTLSEDERWTVFKTWQESAHHVNNLAGAFFTPIGLARDFAIEVPSGRILDLCAGIGALSFAVSNHHFHRPPQITCVDLNPDYVAAGRKLVPDAEWIVASIFDLPDLGRFDCVIGNPPFGNLPKGSGRAPRYSGKDFEYHLIDIASDLADYGVFIIPQMSAPFEYSGRSGYIKRPSERCAAFEKATGVVLEANCGIDTSIYARDWHGVAPRVEIVTADFRSARERRAVAGMPLFEAAA